MVEVLQAGLLATIQDLGRPGYRASGIHPGGAMDRFAMRAANVLLGNPENAAVLEIHFPAPRLRFRKPAWIAICGGDFSASLGPLAVELWRAYSVVEGTELSFRERLQGARTYLAIHGGWAVPKWLGSRSTHSIAHIGGFEGRAVQKGDLLPHSPRDAASTRGLPWSVGRTLLDRTYSRATASLIPGPEWEWLTPASQQSLLEQPFVITPDSDRTGYRLQGDPLEKRHQRELLSSGTAFGTLQLLPSGQVIVLMADHPVTGGYPRIGCVATADLPYLAQCQPGSSVRFSLTSVEDARRAVIETDRQMQQFAAACSHRIEEWLAHPLI